MATFICPRCHDTYQPHWRDPNGSSLCRTCVEIQSGFCSSENHPEHLSEHPCTVTREDPGSPCRYCAAPFPLDGRPCPNCWQSFDSMSMADIKAVFAADAEAAPEGAPVFDIKPVIHGGEQR